MIIRKAKITDAKEICALINYWSKKNIMLERSVNYIYENIRDFWIAVKGKKIVGCCALHIIGWQELAEVRSLAVAKRYHAKGVGSALVNECLKEAETIGVKNIFALTYVDKFFKKLGFDYIDKKEMPHKIWNDCINCPSFFDCKEKAVMYRTS